MTNLSAVVAFVGGLRTWMEVRVEGTHLTIDTRDNGDTYNECPGQRDINEGRRVIKAIRSEFPEVKAQLEAVDEWVILTINP
jgi:hypothetical protein